MNIETARHLDLRGPRWMPSSIRTAIISWIMIIQANPSGWRTEAAEEFQAWQVVTDCDDLLGVLSGCPWPNIVLAGE